MAVEILLGHFADLLTPALPQFPGGDTREIHELELPRIRQLLVVVD